ncbi:hypothetical protein [Mesorhizobium denitrificans]|uniref:Uncharacterized protein n=1 Tax=Mesorhizobium denitrificans TaxID=2294114 RepID=A0A371X6F4_9HYPH|nr:hypothetical protein [Mesorhizobium denitrificans]RFC64805.1 hypothetical protein DY251_18775 [Mesorhizobium denitrificans]
MNQTVTLSLTGFVSLVVGGAGGYAYTNSIYAGKHADLTEQIATLQKKVDEYEAATRLEVPSDREALAAIRKLIFFGGVKKVATDQGQKDAVAPGAVCSLTITDKHDLVLPKVLHFVKIDGVWASQN